MPSTFEMCIEVFIATGAEIKNNHPQIVSCLQPLLTKLATQGTVKQAKYAIRCFNLVFGESKAFNQVYNSLLSSLDYENPHLLAVLTSLSQVALLQPQLFAREHKAVVKTFVLKKLLMVDRCVKGFNERDKEWCSDEDVSKETLLKMRGHKLMVRWLLGLNLDEQQFAAPVLKLFDCTLANDGDLNGEDNISCLWMLLEPIVQHTDNFPFLSKLVQSIKQTKDAQDEGDEELNKRLYAVCDLAHELLINKLGPIKLAPFPAGEPLLPARLYTACKDQNPNTSTYLPDGYSVTSNKGKRKRKFKQNNVELATSSNKSKRIKKRN